jgi:dienelactone hydrolase
MHPGHRALAVLLLIGIMIAGTASGSVLHTAAPRSQAAMTTHGGGSDRPGWADGAFTGTIYQNDEQAGTAAGFIRLGRNSQRGWFTGTWTLRATQGNMSGVFFGMLLLGCCTTPAGISMPLVGVMQSNTSWFSVRIISPPGRMQVSGMRSASFLPAPDGPYDIGTTSMHLVDREREERFTDDPSDVREMMLQLWYPAAQAVGDRAAYMDAETFDWLKHEAPIPLFWIPDDAYTSVMPHAAGDAPPADERFPVLLFSHGYDGVREIYTSLIETLVSHGYVVAAVQHPYVAGVTVFPDWRVIEHQPAPSDPEEADAYFSMAFDTVLDDIEYVLDVLPELDAPVRACLDLGRVGIYGHSFGGGASAATCNRDARVTAGAALDGFFHGGPVENGTARPFLSLLAEGHFQRDATLRQMWNRTSGDIYMAEVAGAAHYSYTDVGLLLTHLAPLIPRPLVGFGSIEPKRLMAISNAYTLAFFDVYLKGQPLDTLLDLADRYPEVTFDYK